MINYKLFNTKDAVASALAKDLFSLINTNAGEKFTIALSGGSTPFIMFEALAANFGSDIDWSTIHFFWVDERCVDPVSSESNYRNTKQTLFDKIKVPPENIHRIKGEDEPKTEVNRYNSEIDKHIAKVNNLPQFDLVLLGMGDDGHTASIFPTEIELLRAKDNAVLAKNPYSGQQRISLSGTVINNAKQIIFLVTGKSKASILDRIVNKKENYLEYPAAHISTKPEKTIWYLDKDAAPFLI